MISQKRKLKQLSKYKRRRANYRLSPDNHWYALKSHGKPCSCWMCRNQKFRDTRRAKIKEQINDVSEFTDWCTGQIIPIPAKIH